jgi:vanillate O-demethylase monooxygenase subunit
MPGDVLRQYWHPVAFAGDIRAQPFAARLLDEPIVLYRAGDALVCLQDRCIHRGTPLSLGAVNGSTITCAYHGWSYRPDGVCTRIPAIPPEQAIPRKARVPAYGAQERHGLVWVCLDEPRLPIPAFPEYDDPAYRKCAHSFHWQANAGRMMENIMDIAHFPWVHTGVLGDPAHPVLPPIEVEVQGEEFVFVFEDTAMGKVRTHRVTLPFTMHLVSVLTNGNPNDRYVIRFAHCPISARETKQFFTCARNYALDEPDETFLGLSRLVNEQDRRIVEAQCPQPLPLDLSAELHLRGPDAASIAYRRLLASIDLQWP